MHVVRPRNAVCALLQDGWNSSTSNPEDQQARLRRKREAIKKRERASVSGMARAVSSLPNAALLSFCAPTQCPLSPLLLCSLPKSPGPFLHS